MPAWKTPFQEIEIGKGIQLLEGDEIAILSFGHIGNQALKACEILKKQFYQ